MSCLEQAKMPEIHETRAQAEIAFKMTSLEWVQVD